MNGKTKSIILQVAFKGAVDMGVVTEEQVLANYELLIALHDRLGIDAEDAPKRGGGGRKTTGTQPTGDTFILEGELYTDFRQAKAAGQTKPNFPDFKRESDGQGFWLYSTDGEANADTAPLVAAADGKVF